MTGTGTVTATDARSAGSDRPQPTAGTRRSGLDDNRIEVLAGGIAVGLTVLVGVWFRSHPGPVVLDHWGISLIHPANGNHDWQRVTDLRSVSVLVGGSILAALVVVSRDWRRALACLVAPTIAVFLTEYVLKPGVGRRFADVLSFPSGTTTVVGAVAMAWVLAVPRGIRPVVTAVVALVVGLECMAVVALQWHYPSDAVGGAVFGAGIVVLLDGVLHLVVDAVHHRQAPTAAPAQTPTL